MYYYSENEKWKGKVAKLHAQRTLGFTRAAVR